MSAVAEAAPDQQIQITGDTASITFDQFDLANYALFLKVKQLPESQVSYDWQSDAYTVTTPARFAGRLGIQTDQTDRGWQPLAKHLFDYQRFVVERALDAKRYAVWLDTGLGKTAVYLEWARQVSTRTGGRVLILAPLAITRQVQNEARDFYGEGLRVEAISSREALADWCRKPGAGVGICNYEKFIPGLLPELRYLAGLVADESSILKSGGGVIKWNLIKSARGIEYKLSCTATPAPNEVMEYASQASFLEKLRTEQDILWTYFVKNQKTGDWKIRPHARAAFYRFMSSWSIYMRDPSHFGFDDILANLPDPEIIEERLPITDTQRELMYGFLSQSNKGLLPDNRLGVQERSKLSQLAKGFLYEPGGSGRFALVDSAKPDRVAEIARKEAAQGHRVLLWTVFDAESQLLFERLDAWNSSLREYVGVLTGASSEAARAKLLEDFAAGAIRVLISKPQLIGYGLNLQFVRSMIFSGFDDSFERMYQAIRRAHRFGQKHRVRVHIPYIPELEGMTFDNVREKERRFLADVDECEASYCAALEGDAA